MALNLKDKILIVDDEELNLILLTKMMEKNGFSVVCVHDGEQVVEAVTESPEPPLCILMDLMLPNLSGWEATAAIKKNPKTQNIPIIATTALSRTDALSIENGFDGYCIKPIDEKILVKVIQGCLVPPEKMN
jgi:CheY-like chemotaxis protein